MAQRKISTFRAVTPAEHQELLRLLLLYQEEQGAFQCQGSALATPEGASSYLRHLVSDPGRRLWWILLGEQPIGFAVFRLLLWTAEPTGMIDDFYVLPELRRQGHGRRAVDAILAHLSQLGATGVRLQVLN